MSMLAIISARDSALPNILTSSTRPSNGSNRLLCMPILSELTSNVYNPFWADDVGSRIPFTYILLNVPLWVIVTWFHAFTCNGRLPWNSEYEPDESFEPKRMLLFLTCIRYWWSPLNTTLWFTER